MAPSACAMTQSSTTSGSAELTRDERSSSSLQSAKCGSSTSTTASYSASSPSTPLATTSRSELGELSTMSRDICLRCLGTQHNGEGGNRTHDTTIFSRVLDRAELPRPMCLNPACHADSGLPRLRFYRTRRGLVSGSSVGFRGALGDEMRGRRPNAHGMPTAG